MLQPIRPRKIVKNAGFTLIEVLLVMSIFAVLAGFTTVNLLRPQKSADLNTTVGQLMADIKAQQARSMFGDTGSGSSAIVHGVYFEANKYILFTGSVYNQLDSTNFEVELSPNVSLSSTFVPTQVVFSLTSGEVADYVDGSNSVTVSVEGADSKTLTFNKYGVLSSN